MRPVNNIYTPVSNNDSATASHINTFSKDIHSITNRELSASSMRPKRQPMVSFSFDDKYSKNHSEEEVLAEGKHIMNMFQSLQDEKTDKPQRSSEKNQMKMSLCKVIGLGLGLSPLGGLGMVSYFLYRNSHSTTDQGAAPNVSFPTLEPFSLPQTLNLSERTWSTEKGYEVTTQHNVNKSVFLGKLHRHTLTTSEFIDNNFTASSDSNQPLIDQWKKWSKRVQPGAREQRDTALDALRNCLAHHSESLNLDNLYLTELPDHLPDIKFLSLSNNQLTRLSKNLPSGLVTLNISNNQMIDLSENLPSDLKRLDITNNPITYWPDHFPAGLKILCMSHKQHLEVPQSTGLPDELKQWYVDYHPIFPSDPSDKIDYLPRD